MFTVPQITFFSNFFIKNGFHNTIYTFKNYFATVFSVSIFSFNKNNINPNGPLCLRFGAAFFFLVQPAIVDFVNCEQCIHTLFMISQITLFNNFFIKNGSHNTIYTFKNYFATVFSISIFSFSKNKLNTNTS